MSPRLSSIRSIERGWPFETGLPGFSTGERKVKRRTSSGFGFDPDSTTGAFDDALADRKTHASSGVFGTAVQTFKDSKDLLLKLWIDTDPVVLYGKQPFAVLRNGCDFNARREIAAVADCIRQQVLKHLFQLKAMKSQAGKSGTRDGCTAFRDGRFESGKRLVHNLAGVD